VYKYSKQTGGFTIVELLIVIVVIAILAAITIVAYNGIQERSRASAVSSALNQATKKLALYQIDNPNQYPADLAAAGITDTSSVSYQYTVNNSVSPATYCITATTGPTSYKSSSAATTPIKGGCDGHGQGGVAAITNLHRNPGAVGSATGYGAWDGASGNAGSTLITTAGWSLSNSAYRYTWNTVASVNGDIQVHVNNGSVLTAGTTYTVRYRLVAGQNSTISAPALYSSAGTHTTLARSHSSDITLTAGTPVEVWLTFQGDATALASGFRVNQNPRNKVAGHYYELSEAVIYSGARDPAIGFFWGNSPSWVWNGTPNSSTSTGPAS
jgi:prepilin-type N-terminal cleavage/methylation domain-containing protein